MTEIRSLVGHPLENKLNGKAIAYVAEREVVMKKVLLNLLIVIILVFSGCSTEDPVNQPSEGQYFTVQVVNEQFVMFVTDPITIRLAMDNFAGRNQMHPSGRILSGNGGYNGTWGWHYIPETVQMVDVSIEVCDGLPSYVNGHVSDFIAVGYCPWSGKIVKVGR